MTRLEQFMASDSWVLETMGPDGAEDSVAEWCNVCRQAFMVFSTSKNSPTRACAALGLGYYLLTNAAEYLTEEDDNGN